MAHEKKCVDSNLRTKNLCKLPTAKTKSFGLESLYFRGTFLWNTLDNSINNEPTLLVFKNKRKIGLEKNAAAGSAANLLFCI